MLGSVVVNAAEDKVVDTEYVLLEKLLGLEEEDARSAFIRSLSDEQLRVIATDLSLKVREDKTVEDGESLQIHFVYSNALADFVCAMQLRSYIEKLLKEFDKNDIAVRGAIEKIKFQQYDAIMDLANSNIASRYGIYICGREYAINGLKGLNITELELLFTSTILKELLKNSMVRCLPNLFVWYWKNIGIRKEDHKNPLAIVILGSCVTLHNKGI